MAKLSSTTPSKPKATVSDKITALMAEVKAINTPRSARAANLLKQAATVLK